jgi:hypothetical protein
MLLDAWNLSERAIDLANSQGIDSKTWIGSLDPMECSDGIQITESSSSIILAWKQGCNDFYLGSKIGSQKAHLHYGGWRSRDKTLLENN